MLGDDGGLSDMAASSIIHSMPGRDARQHRRAISSILVFISVSSAGVSRTLDIFISSAMLVLTC